MVKKTIERINLSGIVSYIYNYCILYNLSS